jgi:outer membrane autotransporter protein
MHNAQAAIKRQLMRNNFVTKPLVNAVAIAVLGLGSNQVFATPGSSCGTVSDAQTTTQTVSGSCTVTSAGSIDVTGNNAIDVSSSSENSTYITNDGRISGDTAIYVQDTSTFYSTEITNNGTIIGSSYAVSRNTSAGPQNIIIENTSEAELVGGINATSIFNEGTITLKSNVDINDIENTGDAASAILTGDYIGESGSTLRIAIVSTGAEGSYSYLQANGAYLESANLDVDVKSTSGLAEGDIFHIVRSQNFYSDTEFAQVTDNSAMFDFVQDYLNTTSSDAGIYITAERVLSAYQASGKDAGNVLDSGAEGLDDVVTALGLLETEQEVADAVDQTLPLLEGGANHAMGNALKGGNQVVQSVIEGQTGHSSGDMAFSDQHAWVKPFGSWAEQDDINGVSGYDASTYGIVLGSDARLSDKQRLGVAFGYSNSNVDSNSAVARQSADVNSYQFIVYGSHSLNETTDINFQADIGHHNTEGTRHIALTSTTASSDYNSWSAHVGAGLSREYTLSEKTKLTPTVRFDYTSIRDESYTETGAGALNLSVDSNTTEELVLGLGGKLTHEVSEAATLTAKLGVGYDVMDQRDSITAAFAGAPSATFVTEGLDSSPWLVNAGVGIVNQVSDSVEFSANYAVDARDDFTNQTASVKVRWMF